MFGATSPHSPTYFCALLTEQKYGLATKRWVWEIVDLSSSPWLYLTPQTASDPASKDTDFLLHIIYHYCKQLIVYHLFTAIHPGIKQWPRSYPRFLFFSRSLHLAHHLSSQLYLKNVFWIFLFLFVSTAATLAQATIISHHHLSLLTANILSSASLSVLLQVHSLHCSHSTLLFFYFLLILTRRYFFHWFF